MSAQPKPVPYEASLLPRPELYILCDAEGPDGVRCIRRREHYHPAHLGWRMAEGAAPDEAVPVVWGAP